MRGLRRRPRGDDSGAVAVLVAVLLGGGVLLGMGALVIDVGLIAHEREQLQGGADAGAWAVADSCMRTPMWCATDAAALAQRQADGNAHDGRASAALTVCQEDCAGAPRARTAPCPALPADLGTPFAEVRTSTLEADGGMLLPPFLAQALAGGYAGTAATACAQVAWGPPATGTALAIGIAHCEWNTATATGTFYPSATVALSPGDTTAPGCGEPVPGGWFPTAGYANLAADTTCRAGFDVAVVAAQPLVPASCDQALTEAEQSGEPVLVPITDAMQPGLPERRFRITGFAGFVVEGHGPGLLTGHFTQLYEPASRRPAGDRDYGALNITRIG